MSSQDPYSEKNHSGAPQIEDDHIHMEEGEGPWLVSYADLMTLLMGFFALIASFSKPDTKAFEEVKKSAVESFGGKYSEPYKDLEGKIRESLKDLESEGKIQISKDPEGVTIKFIGTVLFNSGAFVVNPEGAVIIERLTKSIRNDISKYKATIEGHTDNVPIKHPIIASNWELSAIRAARVAQILESFGFQKSKLTIQGWGDIRPEVPNENPDGEPNPANQAKNRRVLLRLSDSP